MDHTAQEKADLEIGALLKKAMGLQVESIGQSTLDRAINRRLKTIGLADKEAYVKKLNRSVMELHELVEEVVIPETWFFRDNHPFEALAGYLQKNKANNETETIRLLSVPCATGEEPYSLAMTLLDCGYPLNRFRIDAVDISKRALAVAKTATYGRHSFRSDDLSFRDRYFTKTANNKFLLNKEIKDKVHFHLGNLLNPSFMQALGVFDVLFCRNVLIYLDVDSRQQAIATLNHLLREDGLLFIGHAEAGLFSGSRFTPAPYARAFAFTKKPLPPKKDPWTTDQTSRSKPKKAAAKSVAPDVRTTTAEKGSEEIRAARRLADQGNLDEAARICEKYIRDHGPSSEAYFLLGVTSDAAGDYKTAIKLLRQALYLEPDHLEALFLLSYLAERSGDKNAANAFMQRAQRVEERLKAKEY